jgi:zinc transport system substrate-binding protein
LPTALSAFGCSTVPSDDGRLNIVCTIYPEYEWLKAIVGDSQAFNLSVLQDNGSDPHSFTPSVSDFAKISRADLFVYVGGESDYWVEDALKNASKETRVTISLLEQSAAFALEEEHKEGMEGEEEEEGALDEHVWLSLPRAKGLVCVLSEAIAKLDKEHSDLYLGNASAYSKELENLDAKYRETVKNSLQKTLLFADRFPFLYLTKDYDLDYFAAFSGCSAESEASAETIAHLATKVDELDLKTILKIDGSDGKVAETVRNSTKTKDQKILTLNSMQSTTTRSNTSYLKIMEENLGVLKEALS